MSRKYPVLISIPHGGNVIPPEVQDRIALNPRDIFFDGDAYTREIYNFKEEVEAFIETPVARAVIDLNRAENDRPPENPDGVVKTTTTESIPVWKTGLFPDDSLIAQMLEKYYYSYHVKIDRMLDRKNLKAAFDCHSMAEFAPSISKVPGEARPLICLSNRGDENGEPLDEEGLVTCPPELITRLADCFRELFGRLGEIKINDPFRGGYNSISHFQKKGIPWIQIEINRKLYLSDQYFDNRMLKMDTDRILELRNDILDVLRDFMDRTEIF